MHAWVDWLDLRLGFRSIQSQMRNRVLPDGPSWVYTSASCLLWLLVIQCITGLLLMATYCPSMNSAWASVHFIDQTWAGRFLRGIHHYASHAMIILFGVHVLRVLLTGAYRAPRELVWVTGLLLFPLVIVWTVTGNPLSVSQTGISQIQVEGNILGSTPFLGPTLQRILFGGEEIGSLTLTRLYFLHVGLMPLLVGVLCAVHLHQVIKHSPYKLSESDKSTESDKQFTYWPYQSVRNLTTLVIVIAILAFLTWKDGAPLSAPADPDLAVSPRPEWYFRWLFELRRHFTGDTEFVATLIVPSLYLLGLMAAPFVDRFSSRRMGTICRVVIVVASLGGWTWLTGLSYLQDWNDPEYHAEQTAFAVLSSRALELARTEPITEKGAIQLLRLDPQTQGPKLFARHCVSCHSHADTNGQGLISPEPSAPNLFGIGTAEWIERFLDPTLITSQDVFGGTKFREGDMSAHIQGLFPSNDPNSVEKREMMRAMAVALAEEAGVESVDTGLAARGRDFITSSGSCTDCHRFRDQGELGSAPVLTAYASAEWLKHFISKPTDEKFYRDQNDRMPEFANDPVHAEMNLLSPIDLDLLVRWLRQSTPGLQLPMVSKESR